MYIHSIDLFPLERPDYSSQKGTRFVPPPPHMLLESSNNFNNEFKEPIPIRYPPPPARVSDDVPHLGLIRV